MLTFFRRIRKGLLDMGDARKYLLYAIGEVLLVMIGILLALQVSNWNEGRKDRVKEKVLLNQLHDEFVANKKKLQRVVTTNRLRLQGIRELTNLFPIDPSAIERKTLSKYFGIDEVFHVGTATFNPSNAIINAITNNNSIDIISNDTLKHKILSWHAILANYMEGERITKQVAIEQYEPYLISQGVYTEKGLHDNRVDISFLATPQFESHLQNRERRLSFIYDGLWNHLEILQSTIDEMIRLTVPYNESIKPHI